jgi:glucose/arabinose dehydrogenase
MPKTGLHNGVAVADDGSIYLPSDTDAALYRLSPARHAARP